MPIICARIPNQHDATSHYRGFGPLGHLRKTSKLQWNIHPCAEFSASVAYMCDLAFFQRPKDPAELMAIRIFKRLGVPVIIDFDDLLLSVPRDNPAHDAYMNEETQRTILDICREASAIIVSTNELKRCLQLPGKPLNDRVYVVPNALDEIHLLRGTRAQPPTGTNRTVLWRGSATHERDVFEFAPEIADCAKADRSTAFTFVGWNPWFLTERMEGKQAIIAGQLPLGEFLEFLHTTAPQIGIVPLHASRFNLCKSNIAWLEMTWSGAACLVPDWEEWQHPGAVTYRTTEDFRAGLLSLMGMEPEALQELNRMAWKTVLDKFLLKRVNPLREQVMLASMGMAEWPDGGGIIPEFYKQEENKK